MAWTSPRTWVSGEVPTAAIFNTHVRDNLKAIGDPWTAYGSSTTILTASTTSPTLGTGSSATAWYLLRGKTVDFRIEVICGTSGVAAGSGTYQFLLPVAPAASYTAPLGHGFIQDGAGTAVTVGALLWSATTVAHYYQTGLAATTHALAGAATNRRYMISGTYEAA